MKKILLLILSIQTLLSCGQSTNTFDSDLLSFTYPANYKEERIENAPHMLIKIASVNEYFSISVWNYAINDDVSIWDEQFYEHALNMPIQGKLLSLDKVLIETKNGEKQCLKIKSNADNNMKMLTYLLINEGYLYVLVYTSPGEYTISSTTQESDRLIKGIFFKQIKDNYDTNDLSHIKAEVKKYYTKFCAELNKQLPATVDEVTTLQSVAFIDWTFSCHYAVRMDFADYSDSEIKDIMRTLKKNNKDRVKYLLTRGYNSKEGGLIQMMQNYGLKIRQHYVDENGITIGSILYDYKDFENN